jgi:hypothetical protein
VRVLSSTTSFGVLASLCTILLAPSSSGQNGALVPSLRSVVGKSLKYEINHSVSSIASIFFSTF